MFKFNIPGGGWSTSGYDILHYLHVYPDPKNVGWLTGYSGAHNCREFYVQSYRGKINGGTSFTPWARKAYCILTYGRPISTSYADRQTALMADAEKSLYIINSFEKAHKWPLTKIYPVVCENVEGLTLAFFSGPRKWTTSPYLMSMWSLFLRLGRNPWLPKNLKSLDHESLIRQILIAAKSNNKGGDSDASQMATLKQWDVFLGFYKELFGDKTRKYHWAKTRLHGANDRPEGIRMLLNQSSGYKELSAKFYKLKKEKKKSCN